MVSAGFYGVHVVFVVDFNWHSFVDFAFDLLLKVQ